MLRRLSEASSFLSRGSPSSTAADTPPPLPSSESSHSLSSTALTEALSYDLVPSPQPDRVAHANEDLRQALEELQQASPSDVEARLSALATIQLVLQEHEASEVQSAFASLGGFEIVVGALASVDGAPRPQPPASADDNGDHSGSMEKASPTFDEDDVRYHLATLIFHVLHLALRQPANANSLSFSALASALDLSGIVARDLSLDDKTRGLSLLWAFFVGDFSEGTSAVLVARSRVLERLEGGDEAVGDTSTSERPTPTTVVREVVAARRDRGPVEKVAHPAAAQLLLELVESTLDANVEGETRLRLTVLALVGSLLDRRDGERSVARLSEAGMLRVALERVVGCGPGDGAGHRVADGEEKELWREMVVALLSSSGAGTEDARRLFQAADGGLRLDAEVLKLMCVRRPCCVFRH